MTLGLSQFETALMTESGPMFLEDDGKSELGNATPSGQFCCCSIELNRENQRVHLVVHSWDGPDPGRMTGVQDNLTSNDLFRRKILHLWDVGLPGETEHHIQSHGLDSEFLLLLFAYTEAFVAWHMGVCSHEEYCAGVSSEESKAVEVLIDNYLRPLVHANCSCGEYSRKLVDSLQDVGY